MTTSNLKILFAGEGGQGVQAIGEILAMAAIEEGKKALIIPNFGVEQRGGVSLAFVTVDQKPIDYPKFEKADILAILSDRCFERIKSHQGKKTILVKGPAVKGGLKTKLPPKVWNILVLGEVNRLGKVVKKESLKKAMDKRFQNWFKKNPELRELDFQALG